MGGITVRKLCLVLVALVVVGIALVLPAEGQPIQYGHTWGTFAVDSAFGIETDPAGNVYLAGQVWNGDTGRAEGFVAKFDRLGNLVWDRLIRPRGESWIQDLARSASGDLYILQIAFYPATEVYVIRMTADGDLVFVVQVVGLSQNTYRIQVDPLTDGPLLFDNYPESYVVALDASGNPRWGRKSLYEGGSWQAQPWAIAADASGNVYAVLDRASVDGEYDLGIVKFNSAGTVVAQKLLSIPGVGEYSYDLVRAADGSLVGVGGDFTVGDVLLTRLDDSLRPIWTERAGAPEVGEDMYYIVPQSDGTIYAVGDTWDGVNYLQALYHFRSNGDLLSATGIPHGWPATDRVIYDATSANGVGVLLAGETWGSPSSATVSIPNVTVTSIARSAWIDDTVTWEVFPVEVNRAVDLLISDPVIQADDFSPRADYQAWFGAFETAAPALTVDAASIRSGETTAEFAAKVSGGSPPYTFRWSFGDGTTSTAAAPTHAYASPGSYFAQVVVQDSAGRYGYDTEIVRLTVPPIITYAATSTSPAYVGQTVYFDAFAEDLDGGWITTYRWDFGDGNVTQNDYSYVGHAYSMPGSYAVVLTVTDDEGEQASLTFTLEVLPNAAPVACFSWFPLSPHADAYVTFDGRCSADSNGYVASWTWDFGDAGTGSGSVTNHYYRFAGLYRVTLTVRDEFGAMDQLTEVVNVTGIPGAATILEIRTRPQFPAQIFIDGIPRDEWNLRWTNAPAGVHAIAFGPVHGWIPPDPFSLFVAEGVYTFVDGAYFPMGFLRVTTSPAINATISINGIPRDDWGYWMPMAPGTYTVSFGAAAGYTAPAPTVATVLAGENTHVTGTYVFDGISPGPEPASFGRLRVTTAIDDGGIGVAGTIYVDGIARDEWALNFLKLAPGEHTVSFSDVAGLGTPEPRSVTILAGQTTETVGTYRLHGYLRVITSPSTNAPISVDGVRRNDHGMWQSMPPGTYTVSFGAAVGYTAPIDQTAVVVAGTLTEVLGTYVPTGSPANRAALSTAAEAGPSSLGLPGAERATSRPALLRNLPRPVVLEESWAIAAPPLGWGLLGMALGVRLTAPRRRLGR